MNAINKQETFLTVLQAHKGIIYKIAAAYCAGMQDREDLVQETIIQLWKSFDNYSDRYKYSTWIYRIALNTAISFYRKENRRKQVAGPLPVSIIEIADAGAMGETEKNIAALHQFIAGLKEFDKALMLLYLEEKTYREIATIMGISETNVATRIGRIKVTLKQKFTNIQTH